MLLVFIAAKSSVAPTVVTMVGGIVAIFTAIIGIFQPPRFPKIEPKITKGIVVIVLIVDFLGTFLGTVGWAGWSYYRTNRDIDVLSTVALSQNIGVLPNHHAALDATVTEPRDTIVLEFKVEDNNPHIGSCLPNTVLSMTSDAEGNHGETVSAISGVPASVNLLAGSSKLHLDISVTNTRGDENCSVDLRVVSAKLRNK